MTIVIRQDEVTDGERGGLSKYFPERQMGDKGRQAREMLNGIFWIARSGAAWRDLPERYGPWQTVYKRFREWSESGLIEKIFHELARMPTCRTSAWTVLISRHIRRAPVPGEGALTIHRERGKQQAKSNCP